MRGSEQQRYSSGMDRQIDYSRHGPQAYTSDEPRQRMGVRHESLGGLGGQGFDRQPQRMSTSGLGGTEITLIEPSQRLQGTSEYTKLTEQPVVVESRRLHEVYQVEPTINRERRVDEYRPVIVERHESVQAPMREIHKAAPAERIEIREKGQFDLESALANERQKLIPVAPMGAQISREDRELQPVVRERVRHRVIEDVQPVVMRDVDETHLIHVQKPIDEQVVDLPIVRPAVILQERASGGTLRSEQLDTAQPKTSSTGYERQTRHAEMEEQGRPRETWETSGEERAQGTSEQISRQQPWTEHTEGTEKGHLGTKNLSNRESMSQYPPAATGVV